MSAHYLESNGYRGVMHCADIYRYKGVTFEWHRYCGPFLLNKNMEPSKRNPGPKFWAVVAAWQKLTKKQQEKFRIYG